MPYHYLYKCLHDYVDYNDYLHDYVNCKRMTEKLHYMKMTEKLRYTNYSSSS